MRMSIIGHLHYWLLSAARLPPLRRGPRLCAPASQRVCLFQDGHHIILTVCEERSYAIRSLVLYQLATCPPGSQESLNGLVPERSGSIYLCAPQIRRGPCTASLSPLGSGVRRGSTTLRKPYVEQQMIPQAIPQAQE